MFATRTAQETAADAVQIFGGRGITKTGMGALIEGVRSLLFFFSSRAFFFSDGGDGGLGSIIGPCRLMLSLVEVSGSVHWWLFC
jgi:hypothetical protein